MKQYNQENSLLRWYQTEHNPPLSRLTMASTPSRINARMILTRRMEAQFGIKFPLLTKRILLHHLLQIKPIFLHPLRSFLIQTTWAKQVSTRQKLDFQTRFLRDECTSKFYNSLLNEAVQTLQSDSPSVMSLPIWLSAWIVLNDLGRQKSLRDKIKQKLQRSNVCFWKGNLENGQLAFRK